MIVCEINDYNDKMYDIMNPLRMDVVPVVKREGGIGETLKSYRRGCSTLQTKIF